MPLSMAALLRRRGFDVDDVPGVGVERALEESELLPQLLLPCNPRCREVCDWSAARGRMPKLCSGKCRQQFTHNYERLEREMSSWTGQSLEKTQGHA